MNRSRRGAGPPASRGASPAAPRTRDETVEGLTLIQTGRRERIPVILFGKAFWERLIDGQSLVDEGLIGEADLGLFRYAETAEEAMAMMGEE